MRLLPLRSRPPLPVYRNHSPSSLSSSYLRQAHAIGKGAAGLCVIHLQHACATASATSTAKWRICPHCQGIKRRWVLYDLANQQQCFLGSNNKLQCTYTCLCKECYGAELSLVFCAYCCCVTTKQPYRTCHGQTVSGERPTLPTTQQIVRPRLTGQQCRRHEESERPTACSQVCPSSSHRPLHPAAVFSPEPPRPGSY